jgi:hypothetical protein
MKLLSPLVVLLDPDRRRRGVDVHTYEILSQLPVFPDWLYSSHLTARQKPTTHALAGHHVCRQSILANLEACHDQTVA